MKTIFKDRYVVWFTAAVCVFHITLGLVRYFFDLESLLPFDYALVLIAVAAWIIHLVVYRVKPNLGMSSILLIILFVWYLLSCRVLSDTYRQPFFEHNASALYDTLLIAGVIFPLGVYFGRKGSDIFVRALVHILVFAWTCFMVFVLINVFQNHIIKTPSGGEIGMNKNIALCLNTHYNTTGLIELVMVIIGLFFMVNSNSKVVKIAHILPCLINLIVLALSNSRTSYIAGAIIFAASVFSVIYNAKWDITLLKRLLIGFAAAAVTVVVLLLFRKLVFSIHENVTHLRALITGSSDNVSTARNLTSMGTIKSRIVIWKGSAKAMVINETRFLFGVTPASVISAITEATGGELKGVYTHNQFLEIGVALGVPAMIIFILFVVRLAQNSFRITIRPNEGLKAWFIVSTVVTLLIANLTEATLLFYRFISSYLFFLFSGWICSSEGLMIRNNKAHSRSRTKKQKK